MEVPMSKRNKEWIDNASYKELLYRWRYAPAGDPMFVGETGSYFENTMHKKKLLLSPEEASNISKQISW
jgi:hypothetical protein